MEVRDHFKNGVKPKSQMTRVIKFKKMKTFKGTVSKGALGVQHVIVEANSSDQAIQIIKSEGKTFAYGENVIETDELRSYIKSKVDSGDYEFLGQLPDWL
jgi:hypothetical protein